jgi:signal transduction histidine kinase/streptogramin lyase
LSHNFVRDIQEDETGTIWIATQGGGLNRFDPQTGTFRHHRNDPTNLQSISSDILSVLYEDRAGLLWIGTRNGGVNTFDPHTRAFRSYTYDTTQPQSLSKGSVAAIYQDNQDILWIGGFDENGLTRFDRTAQTITRYQHDPDDPDSLPYDNIYDIDEDRQGTLWIGTIGGGVATFDRDTETFTSYQHDPDAPDSLSNDVVPVIFEDSQGILWIGTEDGLNIFDRDTETFRAYFHQADNPNSLADSEISAMYEDENGTLWIATWGGGLNRFDRASRTFEHFLHDPDDPQSISDNRIYWLTGDGAGTLWLGTRIGLNRFDIQTGTATRYTEQDGLPTNSALCAQVDAAGDVWVSTNRGLARFDPEQERFTTYSTHDGLSSDNFTGSTCFQNTDGELFFGTVNGFVAFHPEDMTRRTDAPPVVLTGLDILNEPVDLAQDLATLTDLTLAPTDQVVTFAFAALDYADPSSNQYAYQLAGFDAERVQAGDQRRVTYTNLDPGSYTFRVWGSNSDGIWNEAGRALSITVLPPWWETSWFRGAMLGLLVGFVVGGFQWRTQMIRQHNRLLEQQVADRTHDLDRSVQQLQQALDVTRFLYTVSQRISTAMSVEEVIAAYLEQVAAHGRYACSIVLFDIDHQGQRTAMIISGRWTPQDGINLDELRWDFVHAPFTPRLDTGHTVTFADVRDHPQVPHVLQNIQAQYEQVALAIIPLMVRGTRIGIVLLSYPHPYTWQEQDLQPFQTTAAQLSTAIDSRRQHLALSAQQQQVAVLEERRRLARDLHDSATQSLFSISLLAQVVPDLWEVDQQETREALQTIRELTRGALAEMRALLFELRPADAEGQSLPQMLQQQASAFERRTGCTVVVEAEECPDLPDDVSQALLRIVQEALNNIRKHAQAHRVHISLQGEHPTRLCVVDNGRGFDPSQVRDTSFGLISMRERAAAINARFTVCSAPGEGTEIRVDWPEPAEQHAEAEKAEDAQA